MIDRLDKQQQRHLAIGILALAVLLLLAVTELLPQYESQLHRQRASGKHLRSETVALAGAELQRRVTSISAGNGARVMSTQILPTANEKGFLRVALKVRLTGPLPALLQSLYDLETDDVYMFVDNAALIDPRGGRADLRNELRPMNADFELIAYMPEAS
jgi:hypothetical protein